MKRLARIVSLGRICSHNKVHSVMKVSPFIANYSIELRIGADIRKKRKVKKAMEFAERMKKIQEEVKVTLRKT